MNIIVYEIMLITLQQISIINYQTSPIVKIRCIWTCENFIHMYNHIDIDIAGENSVDIDRHYMWCTSVHVGTMYVYEALQSDIQLMFTSIRP